MNNKSASAGPFGSNSINVTARSPRLQPVTRTTTTPHPDPHIAATLQRAAMRHGMPPPVPSKEEVELEAWFWVHAQGSRPTQTIRQHTPPNFEGTQASRSTLWALIRDRRIFNIQYTQPLPEVEAARAAGDTRRLLEIFSRHDAGILDGVEEIEDLQDELAPDPVSEADTDMEDVHVLPPALITTPTELVRNILHTVIPLPNAYPDGQTAVNMPPANYQHDPLPLNALKSLAQQWLNARGTPSNRHMFDRLPLNYHSYSKLRPDKSRVDRFIFGHPNGPFDSVDGFFIHFRYMMENQSTDGCECRMCLKK